MEEDILQGEEWEAFVHSFFDVFQKDKKGFIDKVSEQVKFYDDIGYMGFPSLDEVESFVEWSVFSESEEWREYGLDGHIDIIREALEACEEVLDERIYIFIFPTVNKFVLEKMNGVSGYCQYENTIILNVNPVDGWEDALKETVVHELSHALRQRHNSWNDVKDQLVMEGIAEHFREHFIGGEKSSWAKSISRDEARQFLGQILEELGSQDQDFHRELFYGTGDYPLWAGYAIGYHIVGDWLETKARINWDEVFRKPAHEVIIESPFTNPFAAR